MIEWVDKIITGDALELLKQIPSDFVDCVITSPPYWNLRDYSFWQNTILKDVPEKMDMYFVHSFAAYPDDMSLWLCRTPYGSDWFCSFVHKDNVYGCQFHPEKSQAIGLKIIKNFVQLC